MICVDGRSTLSVELLQHKIVIGIMVGYHYDQFCVVANLYLCLIRSIYVDFNPMVDLAQHLH